MPIAMASSVNDHCLDENPPLPEETALPSTRAVRGAGLTM